MTWTSSVACGHRGVLGRPKAHARWSDAGCGCPPAPPLGGWRLGTIGVDPARVVPPLEAARAEGLPIGSALVRLATRSTLPACSMMLADGEDLGALAWGRPLFQHELDRWEYAVADRPLNVQADPLDAGTVLLLAPCGPTRFWLGPPSRPVKEFSA